MTRTEQIRHSLLSTLYGTRGTTVAATLLQREVSRECGGVTLPETVCELKFFEASGMVAVTPDPMGSTLYYQLTAAGVLQY